MSDKLRAAAQAALETLDILSKLGNGDVDGDSVGNEIAQYARQNLRAALAEPDVQESLTTAEPVAWKHPNKNMVFWEDTKEVDEYHKFEPTIPLYSAPPRREWVGLTGPEVEAAYKSVSDKEWAIGGLTDARVFFCAIEAKLREKNGG